jgi:hypothetical protein
MERIAAVARVRLDVRDARRLRGDGAQRRDEHAVLPPVADVTRPP